MMCKNKIKLKTALLAGIMLTGVQWAYAQTTADQVNLNVKLVTVQNIAVNSAQETVTLIFDEAGDYINGVSENQSGHLIVTSTSGFQVKVSASGDLNYGTNTIPVKTISVEPSGAAGEGESFTPQSLSTTEAQIISSTYGKAGKSYDISYVSAGGSDYMDIPSGTYTTTVTYTISPA
ncbi:MAG: hypothetical protein AB7D05_01770 [Mangrovibacterium sp.]